MSILLQIKQRAILKYGCENKYVGICTENMKDMFYTYIFHKTDQFD